MKYKAIKIKNTNQFGLFRIVRVEERDGKRTIVRARLPEFVYSTKDEAFKVLNAINKNQSRIWTTTLTK